MERESEQSIQENNGSPRGQGQDRQRSKGKRNKLDKSVILGQQQQAGVPPAFATQGAPVGGPVGPHVQAPPAQAQGPQVNVQPQNPRGFDNEPAHWSNGSTLGMDESAARAQSRGAAWGIPGLAGLAGAAGSSAPYMPRVYDDAQQAAPPQMEQRKLGGYSNVGNMMGFNTALDYDNESAKNSMKNNFGQIASRYEARPDQMSAIFNDPDFKQFFPNARMVEGGAGDKIDFGGQVDPHSGAAVGVVDVGGAFDPRNNTGAGWTWQDLVNDAQGPAPAQAIYQQAQNQVGQVGGNQMQTMLQGMDENSLMELLRSLMGPQDDPNGGDGGAQQYV
jgi:hypothetical protein